MIKLYFEKISKFERCGEPCTAAVPFPQGEISDLSQINITDGNKAVPSQVTVTARWADNSIKWAFINFLADLPGNSDKNYYCETGKVMTPYMPEKVNVEINKDTICINTGKVNLELNSLKDKKIFNKITYNNTVYENDFISGPIIYDNKGEKWEAMVGRGGWQVVESGPVRAVLATKGKHYNAECKSFIDYNLKIYAYAGKPWIKIKYQIINCEDGSEQEITGIELRINSSSSDTENITSALATSNYTSNIRYGNGNEKLSFLIDADYLLNDANEHFPETFYGTFWADWCDKKGSGICATIYQAYQNFPKAMEVDASGIVIKIMPLEAQALKLAQGMAKTHTVFLHFHDAHESIERVNARSLQFQMPDRPILEPEVYERANVFENVFVNKKVYSVERLLTDKADSRGKAYGIIHWGDAPDGGYTNQGRGNGKPVWTNNEYDFVHAAMLMYARSRQRRMLDYALVTAEHVMDIDICHCSSDPLRYHGEIIHSANHVSGYVIISHEWVEGLLDYYHQTGEYSAYETAIGVGENILRNLNQPKYHQKGGINARETGWALRALSALYSETQDKRWLDNAEKIIEHFEIWKQEYGGWLSPYTDNTVIRVPFMISIAVGSLMRFYSIKPEERIKNMIIEAVDDLIENCMLEDGLFYYKELPSLRRMGNNTIVLEALTDAYELTGDLKYLKAGLETFYINIGNGRSSAVKSKKAVDDAVILNGNGPKGFAQSFYPIVSYYRAVSDAGIIKN